MQRISLSNYNCVLLEKRNYFLLLIIIDFKYTAKYLKQLILQNYNRIVVCFQRQKPVDSKKKQKLVFSQILKVIQIVAIVNKVVILLLIYTQIYYTLFLSIIFLVRTLSISLFLEVLYFYLILLTLSFLYAKPLVVII